MMRINVLGVRFSTEQGREEMNTPWVPGKENQKLVFIKQSMYWNWSLCFWLGACDIGEQVAYVE